MAELKTLTFTEKELRGARDWIMALSSNSGPWGACLRTAYGLLDPIGRALKEDELKSTPEQNRAIAEAVQRTKESMTKPPSDADCPAFFRGLCRISPNGYAICVASNDRSGCLYAQHRASFARALQPFLAPQDAQQPPSGVERGETPEGAK